MIPAFYARPAGLSNIGSGLCALVTAPSAASQWRRHRHAAGIAAMMRQDVAAGTAAAAAEPLPFAVRPLHPRFGAEILDLDVATRLDDAAMAALRRAFVRYQVLLLRGQDLPMDAQVAFARHFGEVQVHVMNQYHQAGHPEIYFLTNLDADGNPTGRHPDKGTMEWHTDGSWRARTGLATIMYAEQVPVDGGETWFCDMYGAYEALDAATQARLAGLKAVHNLDFSRTRRHGEDPMTAAQKAQVPPVAHPIVRIHPETGRKCIFLGDHAEYIEGMAYDEGRALIEDINRRATPDALVYRHSYRPRDIVMWDNRCILHRATAYDTAGARRVMRRSTTLGDAPYGADKASTPR